MHERQKHIKVVMVLIGVLLWHDIFSWFGIINHNTSGTIALQYNNLIGGIIMGCGTDGGFQKRGRPKGSKNKQKGQTTNPADVDH